MRMKLSKFLAMARCGIDTEYSDPEVEFVGIKWQEACRPSAEVFPIDFVDAKTTGKNKVTLKFITTKHNQ